MVDFPSAVEEEEVYGFKEMCDPGYQLVEESVGDGSKDKMYTCVLDDRVLELGIQDEKLAKKLEGDESYADFARAAGVYY